MCVEEISILILKPLDAKKFIRQAIRNRVFLRILKSNTFPIEDHESRRKIIHRKKGKTRERKGLKKIEREGREGNIVEYVPTENITQTETAIVVLLLSRAQFTQKCQYCIPSWNKL